MFKKIFRKLNFKKITNTIIIMVLIALTPLMVLAQSSQDEAPIDGDSFMLGKGGLMINPNHEILETEDFTVTQEEDIKEKPSIFSMFSTKSGGPQFGNIVKSSGDTANLYTRSSGGSVITYITANSNSGVVALLDEKDNRYKIALAGVEGWISKSNVNPVPYESAASYNHFLVNNKNELIHNISRETSSTTYSPLIQGKAPSYLQKNKKYLSFDGHYFYEDSVAGYTSLISDYNAGHRNNSVNKNNPYYNYFQYLPARSQSKLTLKDLNNYLTDKGTKRLTSFNTALHQTEQLFIDAGNLYGSNYALGFVTGIHESGFGGSKYSFSRNNYFGHGAFDSDPDLATLYKSPSAGIARHFGVFLNWNYLDASDLSNGIYNGGYVGDKLSGMNKKYASDPYWGEKISNHYYKMDAMAGFKDYGVYTIGMIKNSNAKAYKTTNTKSEVYAPVKGTMIALTKEYTVNKEKWYQFSSDPLLTSNKDLESFSLNKLYNKYNIAGSQLYIKANDVDIVFNGAGGSVMSQTSPKVKPEPKFESKEIEVYTIEKTPLYRDWSTDYQPYFELPKDTKVDGVKTNNGWLFIAYKHTDNYTYLSYVNLAHVSATKGGKPLEDTGIIPPPKPEVPELPKPGTIKYIANPGSGSILRLRDTPSTSGKILLNIPHNAKLVGGTPLNGWTHITYNGRSGYVSHEYIKVDTSTKPPETTYHKYDLNKDSKIDIRDMMLIRRYILKLDPQTAEKRKLYDLNNDNKIDIRDMMQIRVHILG